MEDRFKFRVWDSEIKMYITDVFIRPSGQLFCCEEGHELNKNIYIIEACTGLKDKDGDLIYEGDIVKSQSIYHMDRDDEGCCVFYTGEDSETYSESIVRAKGMVDISGEEYDSTLLDFAFDMEYEFEIIGNIHTEEKK